VIKPVATRLALIFAVVLPAVTVTLVALEKSAFPEYHCSTKLDPTQSLKSTL
jgi:hypothetical protein